MQPITERQSYKLTFYQIIKDDRKKNKSETIFFTMRYTHTQINLEIPLKCHEKSLTICDVNKVRTKQMPIATKKPQKSILDGK